MGNVAPEGQSAAEASGDSVERVSTVPEVSDVQYVTEQPLASLSSPSPQPIRSEHLKFRQLLKLISHGSQMERACQVMQELRDETAGGGGFLFQSDSDEGKVRPELRVMQQCLLSENDTLLKLACETYLLLQPDSKRLNLWFGITPEHISWAKENQQKDVDAQKIIAIEGLCTISIVEDIRLMMSTHPEAEMQLLALKTLGVLLLHPNNRSQSLFAERDVRLLSGWLDRIKGSHLISMELQCTGLHALACWSLCWMPSINAHGTETDIAVPLYARSLVLRLLDSLEPLLTMDRQEDCLESALNIIYVFSSTGLDIDPASSTVNTVLVRFLQEEKRPKTRFVTCMLLLNIARSQLTSGKGLDEFPSKQIESHLAWWLTETSMKRNRPDAFAQSLLLACTVSFLRYDQLLNVNLSREMESKRDPGFAIFWNRLIKSNFTVTCAWFFAKQSSKLLTLPKSVSLSFVIGLNHGELYLFDLIAQVFTRASARDFVMKAYNEGVASFFQNSICQFMYPRDSSVRRQAVKCCKYLVAAFVSHHLGEDIENELYQFLLARLLEIEEVKNLCDEGTVASRKVLRSRGFSTKFDEEAQSMLYLLRLGLTILYNPSNPIHERGAFTNIYLYHSGEVEMGSYDDADHHLYTEEDEPPSDRNGGSKEDINENESKAMTAKLDAENPWNQNPDRNRFISQLVRDFLGTEDSILTFACGNAIVNLVQRDEDAKRWVLLSGVLLEYFYRASENLTQEQLTVLRSLVKYPGGCAIWLNMNRAAGQILQNRSGGQPAVLVSPSGGTHSDKNLFINGRVVLLAQPYHIPKLQTGNSSRDILDAPQSPDPTPVFFVGARISHVENGIGVIVKEDEHGRFHVAFDSGFYRTYYQEELVERSRLVGSEEPAEISTQWTMVFKVGSSFVDSQTEAEANTRVRVLCQAKNGDVHAGVLSKRLGCYDSVNNRWHMSTLFLPDKSQTVVVVGKDNRTIFHLVDELGAITEFGIVDFQSTVDVFSVGNGIRGENPFGVLNEFRLYPFGWEEEEFAMRLSPKWDPEFPRLYIVKFEGGALIRKLRTQIQSHKANATEKRLSAFILCNLALCPQNRLQLLNMLGLDVETSFLELPDEDSENGSMSRLDWEVRARLVSALM